MAAKNVKDCVRRWGSEYLAICGLTKYFPVMNSESHVFFVNGLTGSNSASDYGQRPDYPLLTLTYALSLCTDDKNDFIFVLDYYQATGETWPISITKRQVHIIGITNGAYCWPWVDPDGDYSAFDIAQGAFGVEIAGLELGGGTNKACIQVTANGSWGTYIHDCNFGTASIGIAGKYGIELVTSGELIQGRIEKCKFGSGLTAGGILIAGNGANPVRGCVITDNLFRCNGSGDIAINVTAAQASFDEGGIFNNKFVTSDSTTGLAVTFASGAKGMVDGNVAMMEDGATPANNAFTDAGTGMGWGVNYCTATSTTPVTSVIVGPA